MNWQTDDHKPISKQEVLGYDGKNYHIVRYIREREQEVDGEDWDTDHYDVDEKTEIVWLKPGWYIESEQVGGDWDYCWIETKVKCWAYIDKPFIFETPVTDICTKFPDEDPF